MLIALSVSCVLSCGASVGSASAYQSVDCGIESRLRLIFFTMRKYPGAWRASCFQYCLN